MRTIALAGRCWTARGFADGQTAEHGGEFIDTRHVQLESPLQVLIKRPDGRLLAIPAGATVTFGLPGCGRADTLG